MIDRIWAEYSSTDQLADSKELKTEGAEELL